MQTSSDYQNYVGQHIALKKEAYRWNAFYDAARNMTQNGSGFAQAIAEAYYKADKTNKAKLEGVFLDIFLHHMDASDRDLFSK
jgi:hypothetical protein